MEVAKLTAHVRGLTLVELLTTLTVALVLLAVGVPAWGKLTQSNAVISARNQMRAMLSSARLAALKHRDYVTVCPSSDLTTCNDDHTSWHQGYLLFLDKNGNKLREGSEPLLRVANLAAGGISIHSSPGRKAIRYADDGSAWGSNVTLRFCSDATPVSNKAIVLFGTGRVRYSDTLADGSAITC